MSEAKVKDWRRAGRPLTVVALNVAIGSIPSGGPIACVRVNARLAAIHSFFGYAAPCIRSMPEIIQRDLLYPQKRFD